MIYQSIIDVETIEQVTLAEILTIKEIMSRVLESKTTHEVSVHFKSGRSSSIEFKTEAKAKEYFELLRKSITTTDRNIVVVKEGKIIP